MEPGEIYGRLLAIARDADARRRKAEGALLAAQERLAEALAHPGRPVTLADLRATGDAPMSRLADVAEGFLFLINQLHDADEIGFEPERKLRDVLADLCKVSKEIMALWPATK